MAEIIPKTNSEFFGHQDAADQLAHDFASGKLAHGLLISGPKGVGKATLAYRLARMLLSGENEMQMDSENPVFRRISAGSHSDLLVVEQEFDPKKEELSREISVDQAREIAEFLSLTPGEGKWRVVIVDSVDALNANGANAILKILEEPPPQAVLILISHNPGRLLPTIRSRCRMLKLSPVADSDFIKIMRHVAPDTDHTEISGLNILSGGAPGVALEMKEQGALVIYSEMLEVLFNLPNIDSKKLHAFADKITTGQVHANWQLFTILMLALFERTAKTASGIALKEVVGGEEDVLIRLANLHSSGVWAEKWQGCADQFSLAQARHLDYKQIIITFIHSLGDRQVLATSASG